MRREITQEEPEKTMPLSTSFSTLGGHRVKAVVTPARDTIPENNVYYTGNYSDYVRKSGGLVVIGGRNSYDRGDYKNSLFEVYLPVRAVKTRPSGEELALVLAIDISGSTGELFGGYTKAEVEKAIAIGITRYVKKEHHLGVVAFDTQAYLVAGLSSTHDRYELEEKIASLSYGGGTSILAGQLMAEEMLTPFQGSKYLILITDGLDEAQELALERAEMMAEKGIKTHVVGVGYNADDAFLSSLAAAGRGIYFREGEEGRIKLLFGEEEEEPEVYPLIVLDSNHFINWVLRETAWGDIRVSDVALGEPIVVTAGVPLNATLNGEPLVFDALGYDRYPFYYPLAPGFYSLEGDGVKEAVGVNYPLELLDLGFNPELEAVVKATGGRVLSMDELQSIEEEIREKTRKKRIKPCPSSLQR